MYIRWSKIEDAEEIIELLKTYALSIAGYLQISEKEALKRLDLFYNNGLKDLLLRNPFLGSLIRKTPES